MKFKTITF